MMKILSGLIACLVWATPTAAQECLNITPEIAAKAAKLADGAGHCDVRCEGCGCKGGPGFRGPNGKCVGWKDLVSVCGAPPYSKCARECTPVVGGCANRGKAATVAAEADDEADPLPDQSDSEINVR